MTKRPPKHFLELKGVNLPVYYLCISHENYLSINISQNILEYINLISFHFE